MLALQHISDSIEVSTTLAALTGPASCVAPALQIRMRELAEIIFGSADHARRLGDETGSPLPITNDGVIAGLPSGLNARFVPLGAPRSAAISPPGNLLPRCPWRDYISCSGLPKMASALLR